MTLSDKQQQFVDYMCAMSDWSDRFNYLIDLSNGLPEMPEQMKTLENRIDCNSKTFFCVQRTEGIVNIYGWSNGLIPSGLVALLFDLFNGCSEDEINATPIIFHIESGLLDNLTGVRRMALLQMISKIKLV